MGPEDMDEFGGLSGVSDKSDDYWGLSSVSDKSDDFWDVYGCMSDESEEFEQGDTGDKEPLRDEHGKRLTRRICATHARRDYGVTDGDLKRLSFKSRGRHWGYQVSSRMYLRRDVIDLAQNLDRYRALDKAARKEQAEKAAAKRKLLAKQAAASAKEAVANYKPHNSSPTDSGLSQAWSVILPRLVQHHIERLGQLPDNTPRYAKGLPSKKLRGWRAEGIYNELVNLALTCKEMEQLVVSTAFPVLAQDIDPELWSKPLVEITMDKQLPPVWDDIIRNPTACTLPVLKEAAKQLQVTRSGLKDEVIIRILKAFRMKKPCPKQIPASIVFSMSAIVAAGRGGMTVESSFGLCPYFESDGLFMGSGFSDSDSDLFSEFDDIY